MTSDNLFSSRYRNRDTGEGGGRHIISSSFPRFSSSYARAAAMDGTVLSFILPTNRPLLFLFDDNGRGTKGRNNKLNRWTELSILLPGSLPVRPTFADCFSRAKRRHVSPRREEICPPPTWVPTSSFFEPLQQIPPDLFSLHHPSSCPERNGADRPTPRDALFHPPPLLFLYPKAFPRSLNPPFPLPLPSPSSSVGKRFGP